MLIECTFFFCAHKSKVKKQVCFLCLQQAKYEFVNEVVQMEDIESEEELSRFKNESLGMAVLHLSHQAVQTGCTLQDVAKKVR